MLESKSDRTIAAVAKYAIRRAPREIADAILWNSEHPDRRPRDIEFWLCARFYGRKIIDAYRQHKEIDARWLDAILDGDALPWF
ncbi:MAG: hypothetical protein ACYC35_27335 [Pirellulales bacterium]